MLNTVNEVRARRRLPRGVVSRWLEAEGNVAFGHAGVGENSVLADAVRKGLAGFCDGRSGTVRGRRVRSVMESDQDPWCSG